MAQTNHVSRVTTPIIVTFHSPDAAIKSAQSFITNVLYPGENRQISALRDEFGDVTFPTYAGGVRVISSILDKSEVRLEIPRSPADEGYAIPDQLAANFCKVGGVFHGTRLGPDLNRIGHEANQAASPKQAGHGIFGRQP